MFVSVGFLFYSFGAFFLALTADIGDSRLGISIGLALMNVATGLFAPFLGRWLDKGSIRHVMCLGAVSLSMGFFLASRATTLWQFYLLLGTLMGLGAAMMGGLSCSTLVANWFERRRGMALGIATMGVSMSGVFMAPLSMYMVNTLGWRTTFVLYGAITSVGILPLLWYFVVSNPEDMDLLPDGESHPDLSEDDVEEPMVPMAAGDSLIDHPGHFEWSAIATIRESRFWGIALTISLCFFAMSAVLTHMIPFVSDMGFSNQAAAYVLSLIAAAGVAGKVLFGWVTDRLESRYALWLAIAFMAVGVFMLRQVTSYPALLIGGGIFGFGMGGIVPLWGSLIGESFDRKSFGRVMGLMGPCMLPIQTMGVPYAGFIYDRTGNYDLAYLTFLGTFALASCTLILVTKRDHAAEVGAGTRLEKA
jgi:MFS family permease